MIVSLITGVGLIASLVLRPRLALWIGLLFPAVQAFYSPSLLRMMVLVVLFVGVAQGWRNIPKRQQELIAYLWVGVILTLVIGWVLAPNPAQAQGVVVNVLYATVVASLVVVYRMTVTEWSVYLMAWGVFVTIWLTTHDIVVTGRGGALYIGENANSLGMFAALGFVGSFVLAVGRPFHMVRFLIVMPVGLYCLLGVLSSGSRGALLVAAMGAAVQVFAAILRGSALRALLGATVLAIVVQLTSTRVLSWFLTKSGRNIDATTNFDSREQILSGGIQSGLDHLLTGTGFVGLRVDGIGIFGNVSAHNAYIGLFAATGIIPTILLAMCIIAALRRARVSQEGNMLPLVVAAFAVGLSLDWVPAARLGTLVLALLVSGAALPPVKRKDKVRQGVAGAELRKEREVFDPGVRSRIDKRHLFRP